MRATVTKWFGSHHYGFAKPDVPGSEIFLHATELINSTEEAELAIGQRIDCDIAPKSQRQETLRRAYPLAAAGRY